MQHENELKDLTSWQEKINELAKRFCQDENDRSLVNVETYSVSAMEFDCARLYPEGEFGDYVEVESFRRLAERFLLAMELIQLMEQNQDI